MSIEIISSALRLGLALALLVGLGLGFALRRQRVSLVFFALAALAAGVLLVDGLVAVIAYFADVERADYNEHRFVLLSPWGKFGLIAGLCAVIATVVLSFFSTREISPGRRLALILLRTAAASSALILFLQPALELRQVAREPNRVAVIVDTSSSMKLRDEQDGPTRLERARQVLRKSEGTFERWKKRHLIDLYTFASDINLVGNTGIENAKANGPATQIRETLESVRDRYDGEDLAGMVLLSDGLATGAFAHGAEDGGSMDFLRTLDAPVHTLWVGKKGLKDVAIDRILSDEFAFVRTVVKIEVVVRQAGYGHRRVPVTLSEGGKPMRRKWVDLSPTGKDTVVTFEFTPSKVGKYVYEVSTPVAEDEAVAENNSRAFIMRVVRDKFRVLQVAGQPSWDVRAIRGMLKQNPNVDLISFFILRTQNDIPLALQSELSLIPFPTEELFREQLPSFDLIILQNFNFRPYGLGPYLENIREYVQKGGGLAMLGGELSFSSGGYANTPLSKTLPVKLLPNGKGPELVDDKEFSPRLTDAGASHPVTSLRFDPSENREAWKKLPKLQGVNKLAGVKKPEGTVLATHPTIRDGEGKPLPVITVGDYGEGRVLAVTTDTLWHWGYVAAADGIADGRAYDRFWETATRWLIKDPELKLLQVVSDRVQYEPGTTARIDVRLKGRDYKPLPGGKVKMTVVRETENDKKVPVFSGQLTMSEMGDASHALPGLDPGIYRVHAEAKTASRTVIADDIFLVRQASAELDRSAADPTVLTQISAASGGRFVGRVQGIPEDLSMRPPRIVRVDRSQDLELWSGPWLIILALLFLGLEWGLRQRSGYR